MLPITSMAVDVGFQRSMALPVPLKNMVGLLLALLRILVWVVAHSPWGGNEFCIFMNGVQQSLAGHCYGTPREACCVWQITYGKMVPSKTWISMQASFSDELFASPLMSMLPLLTAFDHLGGESIVGWAILQSPVLCFKLSGGKSVSASSIARNNLNSYIWN